MSKAQFFVLVPYLTYPKQTQTPFFNIYLWCKLSLVSIPGPRCHLPFYGQKGRGTPWNGAPPFPFSLPCLHSVPLLSVQMILVDGVCWRIKEPSFVLNSSAMNLKIALQPPINQYNTTLQGNYRSWNTSVTRTTISFKNMKSFACVSDKPITEVKKNQWSLDQVPHQKHVIVYMK